jgi:DNA-binding NtrC family response regulator
MPLLSPRPTPAAHSIESPIVMVFSKDADLLFLFENVLRAFDCRVLNVENIEDSVDILKNVLPQMLLIDVPYPFREDVTSLIELRKKMEFREIPIVIISNYAYTDFQETLDQLQIKDYLTKPINFDRFEDCLKNNIPNYRPAMDGVMS